VDLAREEEAVNGVKTFCRTLVQQRLALGEEVTAWISAARRDRPGFEVVDVVVVQSSDRAFHCVSIVIFFREDLPSKARAIKSAGRETR
jgi:hypothetical protein